MALREIVLDTETTGLSPRKGDRLVEIGAVELINHIPTGRHYHQYINPERDMPAEAFAIHGLSDDFLAGQPVFADIAEAFHSFIAGTLLIIHNASFDIGFLNAELAAVKAALIPPEQVIDTLAMARKKHPMGPNSLDALCKRYGVDNSGRDLHGALLDSELLAEVYLELIGGRQTTLVLASETAAGGPAGHAARPARVRPKPLARRLTAEDEKAHAEFIAKFAGKPLWDRF